MWGCGTIRLCFDFAQFSRILNGTQDLFRTVGPFRGRPVRTDGTSGVDSFAGFNVTSIAVSVPKTMLRGSTSKINVWATVSSRVPTRHGAKTYQQFERQGQQAFATIFIPKGAARDAQNFEIPEHDVANYSGLIPDALTTTDNDGSGNTIAGRAGLLTSQGVATLPNGAPLLLPSTFGNTSKDLLRIALLPDVLRFDLDLPITNPAIGQFGLQNGRTLDFSSIDVPLQLIRQLADVQFPSGIPGGGTLGSRVALNCTAFPACQDRRVLVVLQGTQFIKPDGSISNYATPGGAPTADVVGNDRPFLAAFPPTWPHRHRCRASRGRLGIRRSSSGGRRRCLRRAERQWAGVSCRPTLLVWFSLWRRAGRRNSRRRRPRRMQVP